MIFRQLFDSVSGTYSYLLASRAGGEALILDPVLEKVDRATASSCASSISSWSRPWTPICTPTTSPASASCATAPIA
ncbi:hypothetical protein ACVWXL_007865 [Bradyrhizobium sp. GM22.5]